ncbi:MAG: glycosyltransferase family 39 protein [Chloroflexi bacterium]|nr:glycosyltransferase family 39 protein [Chloroflexota bacterium]
MKHLPRQTLQHLRNDRRAALAVGIAILANLIVLVAYVWSRGGQTTDVTVLMIGNDAGIAVDGKFAWAVADVEGAPAAGGVLLTLSDTTSLPSLPGPRGITSVQVLDHNDGRVLFEDDFAGGPSPEWRISGDLIVQDGVVGSRGDAQMALTGRDWKDYAVHVKYRNVQSAQIIMRARDDGYGIVATVRPFHWNEDVSKWVSLEAGRSGSAGVGVPIRLARAESMKSLVAMVTRPYPYLLLLVLVGAFGVAVVRLLPSAIVRQADMLVPRASVSYVVAALMFVVFAVVLRFNVLYRDHMPYVPDSIAYIFQAKIFASGHLTADPPPVRGAFDFFVPAPFALTDSTWAAQYPFAHPLMLAFGQIFGAPWIIPPMLAAASAGLIFLVGRRVYNDRAGLIAAILLATSPFFIMNASDLMSHNTAGFFLLTSLACLMRFDRKPIIFGALAGLGFGLLLNTRPLTALALTPPFGAYLLLQLLPREDRLKCAKGLAAFVAAAAVFALLFLGWNYRITGDAFQTGYQATGVTFFPTDSGGTSSGGVGNALGLGGSHQGSIGIKNERIKMGLKLMVLHGWPQFIGIGLSLLPFLLGTRKIQDWFFLACAATTTGAWVGYESTGVMYGPRYWYEAMPFLILLAARGADRAADLLSSTVTSIRAGDLVSEEREAWAGRVLVYGFVGVLVLVSVYGWLLGQRTTWDADLVPNNASAMCCVLGLDDRIHRMVQEQDVHDALVLVDPCDNNFVCYGSVFWRNNPTLDGDIVYAKDIPERRQEIIDAYPGRDVYVATYLEHPELKLLFEGSAP